MHESSVKGLIGLTTTGTAAVIAVLPIVLTVIQIFAGIVAIIAGIYTARYYHRKRQKLDEIYDA